MVSTSQPSLVGPRAPPVPAPFPEPLPPFPLPAEIPNWPFTAVAARLPEERPAAATAAATALGDHVEPRDDGAGAGGGNEGELAAGTAGPAEPVSGSAARDGSAGSAHDHVEPLATDDVSRGGDDRAAPAGPARVRAQR